jgi:hypothetical protein
MAVYQVLFHYVNLTNSWVSKPHTTRSVVLGREMLQDDREGLSQPRLLGPLQNFKLRRSRCA